MFMKILQELYFLKTDERVKNLFKIILVYKINYSMFVINLSE